MTRIVMAVLLVAGGLALLLWGLGDLRREGDPPAPTIAKPTRPPPPDPEAGPVASEIETAPFRRDETLLAPLVVAGRVVDARRRPKPGAELALLRRGAAPTAGRSGEDGRFRFEIEAAPLLPGLLSVLAIDEAGCSGIGSGRLEADQERDIDVGTIALTAHRAVRVQVRDAGRPVAHAELFVGHRGWVQFGPFSCDTRGEAVLRGITDGNYEVFARAPGLHGQAPLIVPPESEDVVIVELEPTSDVELRVRRAPSGRAVAGARIEVHGSRRTGEREVQGWSADLPLPVAATDREGRTWVRDLPRELGVSYRATAFLRPRGSDLHPRSSFGARLVGSSVTIEIPDGQRVLFPVIAGDVPAPADGAEIQLEPYPGYACSGCFEPLGHMIASELAVDGVSRGVHGLLARAPDGSLARLQFGRDGLESGRGRETSFSRPRAVTLRVRDAEGAPPKDLVAQLRTVGGQTVGPAVALDQEGGARFSDLHGTRLQVTLRRSEDIVYLAWPVGTVDISTGDAVLEVTLEPRCAVVLRLRIDGVRALPASYRLGLRNGTHGVLEEDPEAGEIRFHALPRRAGQPLELILSASSYPSVERTIEPVASPSRVALDIDLVRAATARVVVLPPGDGSFRTSLEFWREDLRRWVAARGFHAPAEALALERRIPELPPGLYRVVDTLSGLGSEAAEILPGREHTFTLDLSGTGWVEGVVAAPSPEALADATVRASREGSWVPEGWSRGEAQVVRDGSFRIRVPGNHPIRIEPHHPVLLPAPGSEGAVSVTTPQTGVRLKLVHGATATFRLETAQHSYPRHRVCLYRGAAVGEPELSLDLVYDDATGRFGGFEPGTWTLWFDIPPHAPLVLSDVDLGATTDLGLLTPPAGATLRLTVRRKEGDHTRAGITARKLEEPHYERWASGHEDEILLPGLGPGRFALRLGSDERIIESDGASTLELTLDLR